MSKSKNPLPTEFDILSNSPFRAPIIMHLVYENGWYCLYKFSRSGQTIFIHRLRWANVAEKLESGAFTMLSPNKLDIKPSTLDQIL